MRRSIIITICAFNAIIACGLLWHVYGSSKPTRQLSAAQNRALSAPPLEDTLLWQKASVSNSLRNSLHTLSQIQSSDYLLEQSRQRLTKLTESSGPLLSEWSFLQAVMQVYASKTDAASDLRLLREITAREPLPLTLRNSAFRSFAEHSIRLPDAPHTIEQLFALIDQTYLEANSLCETSLQAEHFLSNNGHERSARTKQYEKRLLETLESTTRPLSTRMVALDILAARNMLPEIELNQIYADSDPQLQTALLRTLSRAKGLIEIDWLSDLRPSTPEQEQLIHQLLD